jgi:hypothetical protein
MTDECDRCGQQIPIRLELSRCGALEFSAKCQFCGAEYGGFVVSHPPDRPKTEGRISFA